MIMKQPVCNSTFCIERMHSLTAEVNDNSSKATPAPANSILYPAYFKSVKELDEVDVYLVHYIFQLADFSGCLHHASKKILLSGVRTGGKSTYKDIKEARDTLNRWLEINKEEGSPNG